VIAGAGLSDGGFSGNVTLNVATGSGITITSDKVTAVEVTVLQLTQTVFL